MLVNIKETKYEGADDCGSINCSHRQPVSAFFITTCNKTHSSYQVKSQKEVKSTQKQPDCKKMCGPCKKKTARKKL